MHRLIAHPAALPRRVKGVQVRLRHFSNGDLFLRWRIDGAQDVCLPEESLKVRGDDLWHTTCFEMFLDCANGTYREFNFSPSGQWAAYEFSDYRKRVGNTEIRHDLTVEVQRGETIIAGAVRVPAHALKDGRAASLCAVIEESGDHKSYWSNLHGKDHPDFHDPACHVLDFAAPRVS